MNSHALSSKNVSKVASFAGWRSEVMDKGVTPNAVQLHSAGWHSLSVRRKGTRLSMGFVVMFSRRITQQRRRYLRRISRRSCSPSLAGRLPSVGDCWPGRKPLSSRRLIAAAQPLIGAPSVTKGSCVNTPRGSTGRLERLRSVDTVTDNKTRASRRAADLPLVCTSRGCGDLATFGL